MTKKRPQEAKLWKGAHITTNHPIIKRHIEPRMRQAMSHMRIVAITGARQCGKSTLCEQIAKERGMKYLSLDDKTVLRAARDDPKALIDYLKKDGGVLDEIQRVPDLMLALKFHVDQDQRPGRWIITGSVDMFRSIKLPDHLAGRILKIDLHPFSQSEIHRQHCAPSFLSEALKGAFPHFHEEEDPEDLCDVYYRALRGGYPLSVLSNSDTLSRQWLKGYIDMMVQRHIREEFDIHKVGEFSRLIKYLAGVSCGFLNLSSIAKKLGVNYQTVSRWVWLLENMYLIRCVPSWHYDDVKKLIKAPKLHFLDPGLLAAVRGWKTIDPIVHFDRKGPFLESFVFAELTRLISVYEDDVDLYSYRTRAGVEVDLVLNSGDDVVGVEVKSSPR